MKHIVFVDSTASGLLAFEAAKRLGCYVTFIKQRDASFVGISFKGDGSRLQPYLAHVDQCFDIDTLGDDGFGRLLAQIHAKRPIDALLTTSEAAIIHVAREAEVLGTPYPSHEVLCGAVFKNRLRETLRANGIRSPDYEVMREDELIAGRAPRISPPFVVKPTRGFGKQFSAICLAADDYNAFVSTVRQSRSNSDPMIDALVSREYLFEEYVKGTLHSAEVVVQNGKVQCFATTIRFRSYYSEMLEMTATMPSGLGQRERQEIKDYVQEVFTALNLDVGLYHVELLRDERGPCLVEINARMMGSVAPQMYKMISGVDPFELLIRVHLGDEVRIDDTLLKSAGTVVTVASRHGGRIADWYDPKAFEALLKRHEIGFCTVNVRPGQEVGVYTGNLGTMGHAIILDEDPIEAARKGHRFLTELDPIFGLELAKYFDPATF